MADASMSLKLSPKEFDLMRKVMNERMDELKSEMNDGGRSSKARHEARQALAQIQLFMERLV